MRRTSQDVICLLPRTTEDTAPVSRSNVSRVDVLDLLVLESGILRSQPGTLGKKAAYTALSFFTRVLGSSPLSDSYNTGSPLHSSVEVRAKVPTRKYVNL